MESKNKSNIDNMKDPNAAADHVANVDDHEVLKPEHALLKSQHDNAGIFATAKKFKKVRHLLTFKFS